LDGTLHKIEQQIRRYKDKRTERRTTALKHLEVPAEGELDSE
jgi:ribosome-associated translation inhibitor RaiA